MGGLGGPVAQLSVIILVWLAVIVFPFLLLV